MQTILSNAIISSLCSLRSGRLTGAQRLLSIYSQFGFFFLSFFAKVKKDVEYLLINIASSCKKASGCPIWH
jgi:hypothetical protein